MRSERLWAGEGWWWEQLLFSFIGHYKDSGFYSSEMERHWKVWGPRTDLSYNWITLSVEKRPLGQKQGAELEGHEITG